MCASFFCELLSVALVVQVMRAALKDDLARAFHMGPLSVSRLLQPDDNTTAFALGAEGMHMEEPGRSFVPHFLVIVVPKLD